MLHWILFVGLITAVYVITSTLGKISGGESATALESIGKVFTPVYLILIVVLNIFFAAALFYGFSVSGSALTIAVSLGVIVSFVYSVIVLGATVTVVKLVGLIFILLGIYLLR